MSSAPAASPVPKGDVASPDGDGQAEFSPFGDRLRHVAEMRGFISSSLATKLNVTRGTFARYWNGERLPPADLAVSIADELNVDVEWLIKGRQRTERRHLVAAENADWVELPEYAMMEFNETGKADPIATALVRRDWLQSSLGEASGLWLARLAAPYEALALHRGVPLICKDHRSGDRMIDGTHYLFWVNGGIIMAPFSRREAAPGERAVLAQDIGREEHQYQPVARVVGELARPI